MLLFLNKENLDSNRISISTRTLAEVKDVLVTINFRKALRTDRLEMTARDDFCHFSSMLINLIQ